MNTPEKFPPGTLDGNKIWFFPPAKEFGPLPFEKTPPGSPPGRPITVAQKTPRGKVSPPVGFVLCTARWPPWPPAPPLTLDIGFPLAPPKNSRETKNPPQNGTNGPQTLGGKLFCVLIKFQGNLSAPNKNNALNCLPLSQPPKGSVLTMRRFLKSSWKKMPFFC